MSLRLCEAGRDGHLRLCRANIYKLHRLDITEFERVLAENDDCDRETFIVICIRGDCSQGGDEGGWIPSVCLGPSIGPLSTCLVRMNYGNLTIRPVKDTDSPDGNLFIPSAVETVLEGTTLDYNPAVDGGLFVIYLKPGPGDSPVTVGSTSTGNGTPLQRVAIQAVGRFDGVYGLMNCWLGCTAKAIAVPGSGGRTVEGTIEQPAMVELPGEKQDQTYVAAWKNPQTYWNLRYDGNESGIFTLHAPFNTDLVLCLQGGAGTHLILCPQNDAPQGSAGFTLTQQFP